MKIERRTLPVTLRAKDGAAPMIAGHAAVFNTETDLGWFSEQVAPGAFTRAIAEDDVRALWNHDPNFVLGRNKAGTLRLSEDDTGLAVEIDPPDTQWARDLVTSMQRGDVSQMSFGFQVISEQWEARKGERTDLRTLIECRLFDVSPVTYPAYDTTDVGVRSAQQVLAERPADTPIKGTNIPELAECRRRVREMAESLAAPASR